MGSFFWCVVSFTVGAASATWYWMNRAAKLQALKTQTTGVGAKVHAAVDAVKKA